MQDFEVKDNLGYFPALTDLGVKNFCTWGNNFWGDMRPANQTNNQEKYRKILEFLSPQIAKPIITISAQQLDQVQFINPQNLHITQRLLKNEADYLEKDIYLHAIECDGVLTKESIPVFKTVGDCSVIIVTGIDQNDGKRFAALLHAGLNGTLLQIYKNAIDFAHIHYQFANKDLQIFVYPYICQEHFSWRKTDFEAELATLGITENFYELRGDKYHIDYGAKITQDLVKLGVPEQSITLSNICTFEAEEQGNLFSNRYQKVNNSSSRARYIVGMSL